jgi:hypothetical protein
MVNGWVVTGLIFCIILLAIAIGLLAYYFYKTRQTTSKSCTDSTNCGPTQVCTNKVCVQKTCDANSDCGAGQVCVSGFCQQKLCQTTPDCVIGGSQNPLVCESGLCVQYGQVCTGATGATGTSGDTTNCFGGELFCKDSRCVQCISNSDCPSKVCQEGVCLNGCSSNAQCASYGTPPYVCTSKRCCPPGTTGLGTNCKVGDARIPGLYCVEGHWTCSQGEPGEACVASADCTSNNCMNGVCVVQNGNCYQNYNPNDLTHSCSPNLPYCVNGLCMGDSVVTKNGVTYGAVCVTSVYADGTTVIPGLNTQYQSCNSSINKGTSVKYCVNQHCTLTPGGLNQECFRNEDCTPIGKGSNCVQQRCAPL